MSCQASVENWYEFVSVDLIVQYAYGQLQGLYTSPHMVAVRERIRINGAPLSEEDFAKFFFEVWDKLDANPVVRVFVYLHPQCKNWGSLQRKNPDTTLKPMYFRFMTLLAFHVFFTLKVTYCLLPVLSSLSGLQVDASIFEVGVGGTYDSTNIVPKPIVTGITSLGIDHQGVLGKTLPEIAWQKGGIYKVHHQHLRTIYRKAYAA